MKPGIPVNFEECPKQGYRCKCEPCAVCGYQKHVSLHGGVMGKEGVVYGHEFVSKRDKRRDEGPREP